MFMLSPMLLIVLLKGLTPMPPPPGFWHWCFGSGVRCLHSEVWGLRFGLRGLGSELAVWGLRPQARNLRLATATGNDNGNGRVQWRRLPRTMAAALEDNNGGSQEQLWRPLENNDGGAGEQWRRHWRTMAAARENDGGGTREQWRRRWRTMAVARENNGENNGANGSRHCCCHVTDIVVGTFGVESCDIV